MYRKKTTVIIVMCIAILVMSVGYALLLTKLNIGGSTAVTTSWKVEFSDIRTDSLTGGATNVVPPSFTSTTATFSVDLVQPGDEARYVVVITNFGDIDAEIKGANFSATGSDAIYVEIDGVRKGTVIERCDGAEVCPSVEMYLTIGYEPGVEKDPTEKTKTIEITLEIGQYVSTNPTPDGELIPELFESPTLVQHVLRDNNVTNDLVIDFSKTGGYTKYEMLRGEKTSTRNMYFDNTYYFGTDYTFNELTGKYTLSGSRTSTNWDSDIYKTYPYVCDDYYNSYTCSRIFQITGPHFDVDDYFSYDRVDGYYYTSTASYMENGKGLYYTSTNTENGQLTYYFRGEVENNYVSFGTYKKGYSYTNIFGDTITVAAGDPIIWRIVRINEDGSVRLIHENLIDRVGYNFTDSADNTHIGYMYGTAGSSTYALTHENKNDSTIKKTLDSWYKTHLISYSSYLADAGFCNDRSTAPEANLWYVDEDESWMSDTGLGYSDNKTYYGAYNRLYNNNTPQFACPQSNDLFTTSTSNKGNKALDYPIGLLTLDEVVYAGGLLQKSDSTSYNTSYYLHNGEAWWTMSPYSFVYYYDARVGLVTHDGRVHYGLMGAGRNDINAVRPVINLKPSVTVETGNGSSESPYVIKTN